MDTPYDKMVTNVKDDLFQNMPYYPYACNTFDYGVFRCDRKRAIKYAHVEVNPPAMIHWFVFDIDRPVNVADFEWETYPVPNIVVKNPDNQHAHFYYRLESPVCRSQACSVKALEYASSVENGMCELLRADRGYCGFIAKNPFSKEWDTYYIHDHGYTLGELHESIPDNTYAKARAHVDTYGLGRNCNVFNRLRQWAYVNFRHFDYKGDNRWFTSVLKAAEEINREENAGNMLQYKEVCHIAKSVAGFVARNFRMSTFKEMQSRRGQRKGSSMRDRYKDSVIKDYLDGMSPTLLCDKYPLRYGTIWKWCREHKLKK